MLHSDQSLWCQHVVQRVEGQGLNPWDLHLPRMFSTIEDGEQKTCGYHYAIMPLIFSFSAAIACSFCSLEHITALCNLEAFPCNILRSRYDAASLAWALSSCEVHLSTDTESSFWIFLFSTFSDKRVWCDSEEPWKNCFEASFFAVLRISSCSSDQVNFSCPRFVVWRCIQSSWYVFSCLPFQRAEISWWFLSFSLQLSSADCNLWHSMSFSASSCSSSAMCESAACRLSQRSFHLLYH